MAARNVMAAPDPKITEMIASHNRFDYSGVPTEPRAMRRYPGRRPHTARPGSDDVKSGRTTAGDTTSSIGPNTYDGPNSTSPATTPGAYGFTNGVVTGPATVQQDT